MNLPDTELIELTLREYGVSAAPQTLAAIRLYISLLLRWNERISLTTVTDPEEILRFHFGECMFAASAVPLRDGRLADVGTGAGFPGIALKVLNPDLQLVLIESNAKKAAFLSECLRQIGIIGAEVYRGRFEDFPSKSAPFDFVAARALGAYPTLAKWSRAMLAPGGKLVLWLGERDSTEMSRDALFQWRKPIPIPGSDRRTILVGVTQ
jgi:16S rRNA (guanine527-N7)-methyltransferase